MREFEKNIRKVEPYVPGEQPQKKVIKLNTNENLPRLPVEWIVQKQRRTKTGRLRLILHGLIPAMPAVRKPAHSACCRPE